LIRSNATAEIDLDDLASGEGPRARALGALRDAAHGSGAFVLRGSAIDVALAGELRALARRIFALPPGELAAIAMLHSPHFRGYTSVGSERTQGRADLREQLDFAPERTADPDAANGPAYRRLPGPNQWPAAVPELRPALLAWMRRCEALAHDLTAALLEAIGVPAAAVEGAFTPDPFTRLKIVRYPGMAEPAAQGVGAHRDTGFLTLILDDGSGGLFVRDGAEAIEVRAPAGALIVVLGRTVAALTGGDVTAAEHFVVSPPPGAERISIPYFFAPRLDYVVGEHAFGVSALEVLLRSHPDVAERHHGDLLAAR
jgi:isopenicillin N synthase-like dioxygenase